MQDLLNQAVDYFQLDIQSLNKLNLKTCDYSYRVRYIKDDEGKVVQKIMDRGFIGLMKNKINRGDSQAVVNCFIYGKKTVGFYIEGNSIYANEKLKTSSDFIVLLYNCLMNQNLTFVNWVDNLPTGVIERKQSQKNLSDCINNAKSIESLNCELGF